MLKKILCVCVGCGCDDEHACEDLLGDACGWLCQSASRKRGVCTQCPAYVKAWTKGDRKLSARAKAAVANRALEERLSRPKLRSARS
jgi:hypothetical protein